MISGYVSRASTYAIVFINLLDYCLIVKKMSIFNDQEKKSVS